MSNLLDRLRSNRRSGVIIDSNLLLLFFLGSFDRRQIEKNSRLETYSNEDFELLVSLLDRLKPLITTPHILTEVSNLSNAIPERDRNAYFASFAARLTLFEEKNVTAESALVGRWAKFGLTDACITEIAKQGYLVVTDDFRLSQSLDSAGIDALNFNHLRDAFWRTSN
jgi:rRNA-processing protein FCF1